MKIACLIAFGCLLFSSCASNPVLTGKPQHWKGRIAEELRAGRGDPSSIRAQAGIREIWGKAPWDSERVLSRVSRLSRFDPPLRALACRSSASFPARSYVRQEANNTLKDYSHALAKAR